MASVQLPQVPAGPTVHHKQRGVVYVRKNWTDDWELVEYLYPESCENNVGPNMSSAVLTYNYGEVLRCDNTVFDIYNPLSLIGYYVKVGIVTETPPSAYVDEDDTDAEVNEPETCFIGIIASSMDKPRASEASAVYSAYPHGDQVYQCWGLDFCMDQVVIRQGRAVVVPGGVSEIARLNSIPTFNEKHKHGLGIKGNRTTAVTADGVHAFSSDGAVWTNLNILQYLLWYETLDLDFGVTLSGNYSALGYITTIQTLDGLTLRQAIDHLIPRYRGLVWSIRVDDENIVNLHVDTCLEESISVASISVPANTEAAKGTLNLKGDKDVDNPVIRHVEHKVYDKVIVEGDRLLSCFTVCYNDDSLESGWTGGESTSYEAADDEQRALDAHARVYRVYRIPRDYSWIKGNVSRSPVVRKDGLLTTTEVAPIFPYGKEIERFIPIQETAADTYAEKEYLAPFAIAYIPSLARWVQLDAGDEEAELKPMRLRPKDGELAFEICANPGHLLGLNHFTDASADPVVVVDPVTDWQLMYATIAVRTDERARVEAVVPGREEIVNPRTMMVRMDDAQIWYLALDTITSLDSTGNPVFATAGNYNAVRDDSDIMESAAALAVAWYGVERSELTLRMNYLRPWPNVGGYIKAAISDNFRADNIGTVVTSVGIDFRNTRTEVKTGYIELDISRMVDVPGLSDFRAVGRHIRRLDSDLASLRERTGNFPARWGAGERVDGERRKVFPVDLTQTGGSAGDADNFCSYTYTVKYQNGITAGTGKEPLNSRARIVKCACTAATLGTAYFDETRTLQLWDANETATQTNCA